MTTLSQSDRPPTFLELESMVDMPTAATLTSLSADTIKRRYPQFIVRLSERRVGVKLRHVLAISDRHLAGAGARWLDSDSKAD
jgi:hypothetical protein